jgi:hypothetical protein
MTTTALPWHGHDRRLGYAITTTPLLYTALPFLCYNAGPKRGAFYRAARATYPCVRLDLGAALGQPLLPICSRGGDGGRVNADDARLPAAIIVLVQAMQWQP